MENIQFHRPTFKQKNNSYLPYCCLCQRNTRLKNSESRPEKTEKIVLEEQKYGCKRSQSMAQTIIFYYQHVTTTTLVAFI